MTLSLRFFFALLLGLGLIGGAAACSEPEASATASTAPATASTALPSPTPKAEEWTHGTYAVGAQIQPGEYRTEGDAGKQCYWNRLDDKQAVIDRLIFTGPATMTVQSGDAYAKFGGGCRWKRA